MLIHLTCNWERKFLNKKKKKKKKKRRWCRQDPSCPPKHIKMIFFLLRLQLNVPYFPSDFPLSVVRSNSSWNASIVVVPFYLFLCE